MTTRRVRAGDAIYRTRMKQPFKEHDLISPPPRCINCPARLGSIVKAFHLVSGKPCQVHPNCPTTCPDDRDEGQAYSRFLYQEAITSRQLDGVENQPAHKHFGINSTLSSPYDSDYCSCSNETKSPMENGAYPVMGLTSRRPRKYPGGTPENLGSSKQSEKSGSSRQSPSTSPKPRSKFSTSTSKNQRDGQSPSSGSRRCEESESSSSLRAGKGVATASTSSAPSRSTGTSPGPAQTASPGRSKGTASPLKLHSTRSRDKLKAKGGKHAKFRPTTQKAPSKTNLEKKTYSGQTEFDRPSAAASRQPSKTELPRSQSRTQNLPNEDFGSCLTNPEVQQFLACACRMIMKGRSRFQNSTSTSDKCCDAAEVEGAKAMLRNAQKLIQDASNRLLSCSEEAEPWRMQSDSNLSRPNSKSKIPTKSKKDKVSTYAQVGPDSTYKSSSKGVGTDRKGLPNKGLRTNSHNSSRPTRIPSLKKSITRSVQAQPDSPADSSLQNCLSQLQNLLQTYQGSCDDKRQGSRKSVMPSRVQSDVKAGVAGSPGGLPFAQDNSKPSYVPQKSEPNWPQGVQPRSSRPSMFVDRCVPRMAQSPRGQPYTAAGMGQRDQSFGPGGPSDSPAQYTRPMPAGPQMGPPGMFMTNGNWMMDSNFAGLPTTTTMLGQQMQASVGPNQIQARMQSSAQITSQRQMQPPQSQMQGFQQLNQNGLNQPINAIYGSPGNYEKPSFFQDQQGYAYVPKAGDNNGTPAPIVQPTRMSNPALSQGPDIHDDILNSENNGLVERISHSQLRMAQRMSKVSLPQPFSFVQENELEIQYQEQLIQGPQQYQSQLQQAPPPPQQLNPVQNQNPYYQQFANPYGAQYSPQQGPYGQLGPEQLFQCYPDMNPYEQRQFAPQQMTYDLFGDEFMAQGREFHDMALQAECESPRGSMQDEECQSESGQRRRKSRSSTVSSQPACAPLPPCPPPCPPPCQPPPCCMPTPCCRTTACGNPCCGAPAAFPERCPCVGSCNNGCNNGCCSSNDSDNQNPSSNSLTRKSANQNMPKPLKPFQRVSLCCRRKDSISGLGFGCRGGASIPKPPPVLPMLPSLQSRALIVPVVRGSQKRGSAPQLRMMEKQVDDLQLNSITFEDDDRVNKYCEEFGGKVVRCVRVDYTAYVTDNDTDENEYDRDGEDCENFKVELDHVQQQRKKNIKRVKDNCGDVDSNHDGT